MMSRESCFKRPLVRSRVKYTGPLLRKERSPPSEPNPHLLTETPIWDIISQSLRLCLVINNFHLINLYRLRSVVSEMDWSITLYYSAQLTQIRISNQGREDPLLTVGAKVIKLAFSADL